MTGNEKLASLLFLLGSAISTLVLGYGIGKDDSQYMGLGVFLCIMFITTSIILLFILEDK